MKAVMFRGSAFRYNLSTEYTPFLNVFDIDVAIAGDNEGVLEFSMVEFLKVVVVLKVVVKHVMLLSLAWSYGI